MSTKVQDTKNPYLDENLLVNPVEVKDDIKDEQNIETSQQDVFAYYMDLKQGLKIQAEYIWIGGSGLDIRSKTKTIRYKYPLTVNDLPIWNFDGSSTGQATGDDSEVFLKPVKICPDPFRKGKNILVLCECIDPKDNKPVKTNHRDAANKIFETKKVKNEKPWYGIEQEYVLYKDDGIGSMRPLGWPKSGYPAPQGPYYCGVGAGKVFGRKIVESHYRACLYAGLDISGINAEVMPGQWEYQIGPCLGIDSGDQMWLSRYLLLRTAEDFGVSVTFDVKPMKGDWNGSGAHTNYSTLTMRNKGGYKEIINAIKKLEAKHSLHMQYYGKNNQQRLTGKHETARFDKFSYGVANRGASVRIPRQSEKDQCGYFEDRRPGANCDPYLVTSLIAQTTLL